MESRTKRFFDSLQGAGMPRVPDEFSVVPGYQLIPRAMLADLDAFIRVFERVTTGSAWQRAIGATMPEWLRRQGRGLVLGQERCFFGAWDLHLPPGEPDRWQLIEFNDNGSGFLFAGLINRIFYDSFELARQPRIRAPAPWGDFADQVAAMVADEAKTFFGRLPSGLLLILDDPESLQAGKFGQELQLLRRLLQGSGWQADIGSPDELSWDGSRLYWRDFAVTLVINRSTDFYWQGADFAPLRAAYGQHGVYVAPNPFSYAMRSDKRLLAWLSCPDLDASLGIAPAERAVLSAHVPETHLITAHNLDEIARRKSEFFFKPAHGYASRGILASEQLGRSRLRRLLNQGQSYVAQRLVPKPLLQPEPADGPRLWTDVRVWAYRGRRYQICGRASLRPDGVDLNPPGGWLPTYATTD